tara:strand:- start:88 stop:489 length:402 start_codon:yes stop_codon:yes gene_type:complete
MSKKKGILYHRSNVKELRERSDWNELTEDEKKKLGRSEVYGLGWFETKSEQSFERYWEGEIVNGVPHGSGTYHATSDGATFVGISKNGKRHEGILLMLMETNILVIGKLMKKGITHSGTEQDMTKTETLSKSM